MEKERQRVDKTLDELNSIEPHYDSPRFEGKNASHQDHSSTKAVRLGIWD